MRKKTPTSRVPGPARYSSTFVDDQNAERAKVPAVNAEEDSDEQGSWPGEVLLHIRGRPERRESKSPRGECGRRLRRAGFLARRGTPPHSWTTRTPREQKSPR